jgi:hypothetical protein
VETFKIEVMKPKTVKAPGATPKEGAAPIPQAHQTYVLDRVKSARQNPGRLLDWDEARKLIEPGSK